VRNRRSRSPRHAEIILEGYVELGELRTEGPFGDHTGFYTMQDEYPVFHITCITHRKDPIYAATIVGKPPMEDAWMGKAVERIFLPLMKLTIPEIVDINLPAEGVFHNLMIVSSARAIPARRAKS
jgi:4-hydroxy-3-polyprenylbenzoate decarboxylase